MMNMSDLKIETGNWKTGNRKPETHPSTFNLQSSIFNPQGFTLIEVMVAVSIIAIALVAVFRLHAQTISMNNAIKFHTVAPLLAQAKIAEYEIKPGDELDNDSGDFGDDFPGYAWRASVEDVESEPLESIAENLKKIDVSVDFDDGGFVYHFRVYRLVE